MLTNLISQEKNTSVLFFVDIFKKLAMSELFPFLFFWAFPIYILRPFKKLEDCLIDLYMLFMYQVSECLTGYIVKSYIHL